MHASVYDWVGRTVALYDLAGRSTLEIGSGIVNGTIRDHFSGAYTGVDIGEGNGVDRVEDCENLSDHRCVWHTVISCECLEHVKRPWRAIDEMARVCQPEGHVIVTARGYDERGCWQVHGYPSDYWRVSEGAMRVMAEDAGLTVVECVSDPEGPGAFMHCIKR